MFLFSYKPVEVVVAEILGVVESKKLSVRLVMEKYFRNTPELSPLRGLVRAYIMGLLKKYRIVDYISQSFLDIQLSKYDPYTRNLLRAIIYEAKFRDIPLSRLLRVARILEKKGIAIGRKDFIHIKEVSVKNMVKNLKGVERLAVVYSLPEWIVEYLVKLMGLREAAKLMKAFNRKHPLWLRVNTALISRSEIIGRLKKRGLEVYEDPQLPDLIKVKEPIGISNIPEYREGLVIAQDKASVLVGHILKPRGVVLDATAGPGGKSAHIAALGGETFSIDIKTRRARVMRNLFRRLRVDDLTHIVVGDSTNLPLRRGLKQVLLDPDCSSLGRLGHSPEMRLWIKKDYIRKYSRQQKLLLSSLSRYMDKGSELVYSTCTLTLEENEEIVKWAIEGLGFEPMEVSPRIGLEGYSIKEAQRLYPHLHETVGFFVIKLIKV